MLTAAFLLVTVIDTVPEIELGRPGLGACAGLEDRERDDCMARLYSGVKLWLSELSLPPS